MEYQPSVGGPYTCGQWRSEKESAAALDRALAGFAGFRVCREVRGQYMAPKLGQELSAPRIDRVLVPTAEFVASGWRHGIVGVECKRSEEKTGRPISQLLDYSRAVFQIKPGFWVVPALLFLWPLERISGPLESVMVQHHLGSAWSDPFRALCLHSGQYVLRVHHGGRVAFGPDIAAQGRKAGSR